MCVCTLGTCFLKFRQLLGLKLEILDPALYVHPFAAHLDSDNKANAVTLTALRLVRLMKRDHIVAGRRPTGVCAAALLIAARAHGSSRQPQDVTRILRVCGLTVATCVKEFENTASASMTLDQFNKVELDAEADPPILTKNRIMEARARAIQSVDMHALLQQFQNPRGTAMFLFCTEEGKVNLETWVSTQRQLKTKAKLDPDRQKQLEDIGFEWVLLSGTNCMPCCNNSRIAKGTAMFLFCTKRTKQLLEIG
jgi:hypothetical protein